MGDKDTKLAVIAIVVEKEEGVRELNELLHGCSGYIIGRMESRTGSVAYR